MEEIDDLFAKVADHPVKGMRLHELAIPHPHLHTKWNGEPATSTRAIVHMSSHGSSLDAIMGQVLRGEAPEGMVPLEDADRALADIRRIRGRHG